MMPVRGAQDFVSKLRELKFPNAFNPYVDRCDQYDKPCAPEIRARVVFEIVGAAGDVEIDAIWIGRDLGHRGGRRTGLALTDDFHFSAHTTRWGVVVERPTQGPLVRERTATVVWEMLAKIEQNVFLWNLFPLHPFPEGNVHKNRAHSAVERDAGVGLLLMLVALLQPRRLVAIGKDSSRVLRRVFRDIEVWDVRHPSYGGEKLFREETAALYGLGVRASQSSLCE